MIVNHHRNLMAGAVNWSLSSRDVHTKVGAAIVSSSGRALMHAANDLADGVYDKPERRGRPAKYVWTCHAEAAAIASCAKQGISCEGASVYVTHYPCARCADLVIMSGIRTVIYGPGKTSMPEEEFVIAAQKFAEAGVKVHSIDFVVDNNWET